MPSRFLALAGLLLLALPCGAAGRPGIAVEGVTPDLGAVAAGTTVRWTLTLHNETDEPLMFAPRPAARFTWKPAAIVVEARGTAAIEVAFEGGAGAVPPGPEWEVRRKAADARGWEEIGSGTLSGPGAFSDARWNTWVSPRGNHEEVVPALAPRRTYVVTFDLSPWAWDAAGVASASPDPELRAALSAVTDPTVTLRAVPVITGRAIRLARASDRAPSLVLDLAKLRTPGAPPREGESVAARSARLAAGRVEIAIDAVEEGCGTVALSLWDEDLRRPLDHVERTIQVTRDGKAAAGCAGATGAATAGLGGLLGGAQGPKPQAALHVFEAGGTPVAVYVDAASAAPRAWPLAENPAAALGDPLGLVQDLDHAHSGAGYGPLQRRLARLFFPPGDPEAKAALASLRKIAAQEPGATRPVLLARLVDRGAVPRALPLALVDDGSGEPIGSRIDVVQAFPARITASSSGAAAPCIDSMHFFVPAELAAGVLPGCSAAEVPGATWPEFESWLDAEEAAGSPESVLVLAHQAKGRLGFRDSGVQYRRPSEMTRPLAPGSIAVLVACNAALDADQDEGTSWLSRFERQGADAAVVSPFAVRLDVGVCFARHLAAEIARARASAGGESLVEIDRRAGDALREDLRRTKKTAVTNLLPTPYEFSLVGDVSLRICGTPGATPTP